jgi:V/A-type H+-transporting ATPase subunit A
MKVVGEEGTHTDDYMIYQKSEFLDYVYLQQNTFDKVDGATSRERQIRMFDKVLKVLESKFKVDSKDDARRYMQELRQLFIDWNYSEMDSDDFNALEKKIDAKIAEKL